MSEYTDAVAAELEGCGGVYPGHMKGCEECEPGDEFDPVFSWSSCEGCGSTLGGNRHPAHTRAEINGEPVTYWLHLDICDDCVMYFANGDEPDEWQKHP